MFAILDTEAGHVLESETSQHDCGCWQAEAFLRDHFEARPSLRVVRLENLEHVMVASRIPQSKRLDRRTGPA